MALAAGWMAGGGLEPPVGPDESRRPTAASNPGAEMPEEGFELADRSGCGRSRRSPASGHPLMAVSHGARRAPVTRTPLRTGDFKSVNFPYRPQPWTCLAMLTNTETTDSKSLYQFSIYGGRW